MKAGCEATSKAASPALAASAHVSCPLTTPSAVKTPPRRPPASAFRIVSAVSWPGVTMTRSETPRNAATWPAFTRRYSTVTVLARLRGWSTFRPRRRAIRYARSCSGNDGEHSLEKGGRARHVDDVVGVVLDVLVAVRRDRDHVRSARARLLDVGDDLVVDVRVGRDDDHGRVLVQQRDRAVLHLAGRICLGRDVGDLLQLERAFEADRQADVAPQVEEERPVVVALGDLLDRMLAVEERRHPGRELVHLVEDELQLVRVHVPRSWASLRAIR